MCLYHDDSCLIINYEMMNWIHELRRADTLPPTSLKRRCPLAQLIAGIPPICVLSTANVWACSYFQRSRQGTHLRVSSRCTNLSIIASCRQSRQICPSNSTDIKAPLSPNRTSRPNIAINHEKIPNVPYFQSTAQERGESFPYDSWHMAWQWSIERNSQSELYNSL
ncbi:hypothetical protein BDR22DRAFT_571017 [Usnea florida]